MSDVASSAASSSVVVVAAASSSINAHPVHPFSSPLEEGEVREEVVEEKLSTIREEGSGEMMPSPTVVDATAVQSGQMSLLPSALLSPSGLQLTKSCSTLNLSSLSMNPPPPSSSSRLHVSVSMVNLSAIHAVNGAAASAANDILSGDILRMSSAAHSPSSDPSVSAGVSVSVLNEEAIMHEISLGSTELRDDAEEQSMEEGGERRPKRARIGRDTNAVADGPQLLPSPDELLPHKASAAAEFEPGQQQLAAMDTSHSVSAPEHADSVSTLVTEVVASSQDPPSAAAVELSVSGDAMLDAPPPMAVHLTDSTATEMKACEEGQRCSPEAHAHVRPLSPDVLNKTMADGGEQQHAPLANGHVHADANHKCAAAVEQAEMAH